MRSRSSEHHECEGKKKKTRLMIDEQHHEQPNGRPTKYMCDAQGSLVACHQRELQREIK